MATPATISAIVPSSPKGEEELLWRVAYIALQREGYQALMEYLATKFVEAEDDYTETCKLLPFDLNRRDEALRRYGRMETLKELFDVMAGLTPAGGYHGGTKP